MLAVLMVHETGLFASLQNAETTISEPCIILEVVFVECVADIRDAAFLRGHQLVGFDQDHATFVRTKSMFVDLATEFDGQVRKDGELSQGHAVGGGGRRSDRDCGCSSVGEG
jgi:hypothetical protein